MEPKGTLSSLARLVIVGATSTACMLWLGPTSPQPIAAGSTVPASAIVHVQDIGVAQHASVVYVAGSSGLFRSSTPPYTTWTRQSAITDVQGLSPHPRDANDLLYTVGLRIYRSTDGGRTATLVNSCAGGGAMARATSDPSPIYVATRAGYDSCPFPVAAGGFGLYRSTDDGRTWARVYRDYDDYESGDGLGPIAVDPTNPRHIVVGYTAPHLYGSTLESSDGGHHLSTVEQGPIDHTPMSAIAINPTNSSDRWIAWANSSAEIEHNGHQIIAGLRHAPAPGDSGYIYTTPMTAILFDPLTARVYVGTSPDPQGAPSDPDSGPPQIYAYGADNRFTLFDGHINGIGPVFQVTSTGYIVAAATSKQALVVRRVIGSGNWPVAAPFARSYTVTGCAHSLGRPLSPATRCGRYVCQYFDKGRLEDHGASTGQHIVYGSLVRDLIAAQVALAVGGTISTVTYRTLYPLTAPRHRTAPPAHFYRGVAIVPEGTFIPFSPHLARAAGYIVPTYFWRYMNPGNGVPGGWLNATGLPLTPAVPATVTKGPLGRRSIVVQAFEHAILTYDPHNAAPFRVERANVGVDYAAAFPLAVR